MNFKPLSSAASDIDVVARWLFDEWGMITPFESLASTHSALLERTRAAPLPRAFVVQAPNGVPVGTISLVACDFEPRKHLSPWVADTYVPPEERHRGIGAALVQGIEAYASAAGMTSLYLVTRHKSRFYEHLGWETMETTSYQGESAAVMSRNL